MTAVQPVKTSLEAFVSRVAAGRGSENEVAVLPQVLAFYKENYLKEDAAGAGADGFPEGEELVTAAMAAQFLGFGSTHRFPNRAVLRLSNEGLLHAPVRVGDRSPRWQARWIREYKEKLLADAGA